jgi:TRAP-type mannitol/chloroaromatic compound transport system permease small subunit
MASSPPPGASAIERLAGIAQHVSRYAAWACGYAVLGCAALIGVDIVLRKLFAISLAGTDEISGYVLVVTFAWSAAWALFRDAHIRIDVISSRLPPGPRRVFDLIALASLVGVAGLLAWQAWGVLAESLRLGAVSNTPLRVPLWLPQGLWVLGLLVFALSAVILLIARTVRPPRIVAAPDPTEAR